MAKYDWKDEENINEVKTAVTFAVKHLLKFMNQGGKVDIKLIAKQGDEEKQVEVNLSIKYNEIKKIGDEVSIPEGQKHLLDVIGPNDSDEIAA